MQAKCKRITIRSTSAINDDQLARTTGRLLIYFNPGTRTGNALEYVLQNMLLDAGNRRLVKDFVFVVTDGISTDDVMRPARQLREFGATVNETILRAGLHETL